jgi:hypothetical protein
MQLVIFLSFMIKLGNYIALPDNSLYIRTRRISSHTNTSFLRILSSLMRTREGLPGRSPIALSKTRLTLEFFFERAFGKEVASYWYEYPYQSY